MAHDDDDDERRLTLRERAQRDKARQEALERSAAARRLQWERDHPNKLELEQLALAEQRQAQEARFEASRPKPFEAPPGVLEAILERADVREAAELARKRGGVVAPIKGLKL